jgi:Mrp family chromosome partitioning ATPase
MRAKYDGIIIDAPPLLIVTDPWIISAVVDGLILVVKVGEVRRQALEQTMEILKTLVTPALGVVINGITRDQFGFDNRFNNLYGYGYGNGYGYHQDPKSPPPGVPGRTGGALEMVAGTNCNGKSTHRDIGLDPDSSA